jgi:serum/glucocorticoid-regulated kinase 2
MLTAMPPFYSKKRDELFNKIKNCNPNYYNFMSDDAIDLISKLLVKDPSQRLGSISDAADIKHHPFFDEINWDQMMKKKMITPYKPLLESKFDTKHFD